MSNSGDNDQMDVSNGEDDTYFEYDYELALPDVLKSISVKEKRELLAFKQSHNEIDWEGELVRRSDLLAKQIDLERLKRMTAQSAATDSEAPAERPSSKKTKAPVASKKAPAALKKRRVLQEEEEDEEEEDEEEGEEKDDMSFDDDDDLFDSDEDKEILEKSKIKEKKKAPKAKPSAKSKKTKGGGLFDDDDDDDDIIDDRSQYDNQSIDR